MWQREKQQKMKEKRERREQRKKDRERLGEEVRGHTATQSTLAPPPLLVERDRE